MPRSIPTALFLAISTSRRSILTFYKLRKCCRSAETVTRLEATEASAWAGISQWDVWVWAGQGCAGCTFGETFEVTHCSGALRSDWPKLSPLLSHWFKKLSIDGHVTFEFKYLEATVFIDGVTQHLREAIKYSG